MLTHHTSSHHTSSHLAVSHYTSSHLAVVCHNVLPTGSPIHCCSLPPSPSSDTSRQAAQVSVNAPADPGELPALARDGGRLGLLLFAVLRLLRRDLLCEIQQRRRRPPPGEPIAFIHDVCGFCCCLLAAYVQNRFCVHRLKSVSVCFAQADMVLRAGLLFAMGAAVVLLFDGGEDRLWQRR